MKFNINGDQERAKGHPKGKFYRACNSNPVIVAQEKQ